ncbi:hypothetical protein KSS87_019063 [Heliosperma pusillum]|nr:hypothetical protein KSS87_019063 [Heliosperma pusillum]
MGAACCVAARDRTIHHASSDDIVHRNIRHSASWSFRWDSRVGVAGEDSSIGWISDVARRNDELDVKSATDVSPHVSDGGSSLESYQTSTWRKSPLSQEGTENIGSSASDQLNQRNAPREVKTESPQVIIPASVQQSPSMHKTSSLSSQINSLPPSTIRPRWAHGLPGPHRPQQPSDLHSSGRNSPMEDRHAPSAASNESTRGSFGGSSNGWSTHAFELRSASQRDRCSFDSDSCRLGQNSRSASVDFSTCGICSKLLSEKSAWSSQKIVGGNELAVVSVLICGHVYHADCLETITPEINKYDPACPVCTFGEKQTLKLTGKLLKAEKDHKARNSKKLRNRVVGNDGSFDFDYWKSNPVEGKIPKLSNSSSLRIASAKPFLKRHFSFGSRGNKSALESPSIRKKGLFWAKSSRV